MTSHQSKHPIDEGVGERQPLHDAARYGNAHRGMAVKVSGTVFVFEEARGFSHIMKQRCPANKRVGRNALDDSSGMLEHVEYVIGRLLIEALHGDELGQYGRKRINAAKQSVAGMRAKQQLLQFVGYTFGGYLRQQPLVFQHSLIRARFDGVSKLSAETASPQDAQRIFGEPLMRIADCTDDAELDIGLSPEGVDQTSVGSPSHSIDGEIPAGKIFLNRGHERHRIGMPSVLIRCV